MEFKKIDDAVLHTGDVGRPDGPPIVFANSLGTDFRIWGRVIARLADRYRCITFDKRGHGLSDLGTAGISIPRLADDALGVMDSYGVERAVIIGVSIGGLICQGVHHRAPERTAGLVVCDSAAKIGTEEMWQERIDKIAEGGLEAMADPILERWFPPAFHRDRAVELAGYRNMLLRTTVEGYLGCCRAIQAADMRQEAPAITAPTLVICGAEDGATPPALVSEFARSVPGARYEELAGVGHLPSIDEPDKVADLIEGFLAGIDY